MPNPTTEAHTHGQLTRLRATLHSPMLLLSLLCLQFVLLQLFTGVQFGDAPRNMHWGILTYENPAFLSGAADTFERIKGFRPNPESLGPNRLWDNTYGGFHPWWGPLTPLIFAFVWGTTRSYTLLQLIVPLSGGFTVLLTYAIARDLLDKRRALLAAAFLACYPIFHEYSSVSYTETLSALWITAAFYAYLRGRSPLTILFGTLAALSKMDMLGLYIGVVISCAAWDLLRRGGRYPLAHHAAILCIPPLIATPWIWYHTLAGGQQGATRGFSIEIFRFLVPQMIELTFYAPLVIGLLTLAIIGWAVIAGIQARTISSLPSLLLGSWIGMGLLVLLVYAGTPGAGNSPRVIIPALPALAILFAAGLPVLPPRPRRLMSIYLIALFVMVNIVVTGYEALHFGGRINAAKPAFAALRQQPHGFVLTPLYWETILYTRQKATWFEADPDFQRNIMQDAANFARYVESNPIRYVLIPEVGEESAAPAVMQYLTDHAQTFDSGDWTLYILSKQ